MTVGSFPRFSPPAQGGIADGPNLYTYVNQNPWTYWDPTGLRLDDGTPENDDEEVEDIRAHDAAVDRYNELTAQREEIRSDHSRRSMNGVTMISKEGKELLDKNQAELDQSAREIAGHAKAINDYRSADRNGDGQLSPDEITALQIAQKDQPLHDSSLDLIDAGLTIAGTGAIAKIGAKAETAAARWIWGHHKSPAKWFKQLNQRAGRHNKSQKLCRKGRKNLPQTLSIEPIRLHATPILRRADT